MVCTVHIQHAEVGSRPRVVGLSAAFLLIVVLLASACGGGDQNPFGLQSELVTPADRADALAFDPEGRLFYAEHWSGNIRVVTPDGQLLEEPFATVPDVAANANWGLTGLALDAEFEDNHYVYAYFTELLDPGPPPIGRPVIIRFTDVDNEGTEPTVIVADLMEANPDQPFNANGSIHLGPDGFLYATLGDYDMPRDVGPQNKEVPQDLGTPIGKILRIRPEDGTAPADNPFVDQPSADPRIFAYGFRNAFDFAFNPETGKMYGSDSTGPTCEELNVVEIGGNYGWPIAGEWPYTDCLFSMETPAIHFFALEGMQPGDFTSTVGVRGMEFVSGDVYPTLGDSLLVCESAPGLIRRLVLEGTGSDEVVADDVVVRDCEFAMAISPDGIIYYSNQSEIRRLVPIDSSE